MTIEALRVTEPLGRLLGGGVPSDDSSQGPLPVPVAVEEPAATVAALLALTRRYGRLRRALDGQGCPMGSVALAGTCTACGACVSACASGALRLHRDAVAATLLARPDLCSACGACAAACPEQVLGVRRGVGPGIPAGAETVLARDTAVSCRRCGAPLGTLAFLARSRPGADRLCASCAAPLGVDGLAHPAERR